MASGKKLHPDEKIKLGKSVGRAIGGLIVFGLVAIGIAAIAGAADNLRLFWFSYDIGFMFALSIALGGLFFVPLQYITKSRWSVVVRRQAELLTMGFPILAILGLPIVISTLVGADELFLWAKDAAVLEKMAEQNHHINAHLIHEKHAFLNPTFFAIRYVIYFAIWIGLSTFYFKKSVEQDDSGDPALTDRMRFWSGPAIILFAFTTCFASFDFLMTLDPHWFSTMFGVYYFAGCAISVFAVLALFSMGLQHFGRLRHAITVEHYHDLGKLLFAFVFFWSYVAFSQFMLIWYGNIPEETAWFYPRMFTDWKYVSYVLLFGHCVFPFLCLLSRETKRRLTIFAFFCVWMMLVHFIDLFYIAMPQYSLYMGDGHATLGATQVVAAVLATLGITAIYIAWVLRTGRKVKLIPVKDPELGASLAFENF